mmetsp:Transcript_99558/g.181605  ORF Transcript_99558/g.181605 Transcript_99558/m.181605 type:complete len:143 (+) Transcript_99558:6-434(+)
MQLCIDSISNTYKMAGEQQTSASSHLQKQINELKEQVHWKNATATNSLEGITQQQALTTSLFEKELNELKEQVKTKSNVHPFQQDLVSELQQVVTAMQNDFGTMELKFEESKKSTVAALEPVIQHLAKLQNEVDTLKEGINL